MSRLVLDRHLLASGVSAWDTAWRTFGWTPALEGARAGRLEEQVPWGARTTRREGPARLVGPPGDVADPENLERLGRAFLELDGRLGYALWGAVGSSREGAEWRVATHTVLFDVAAFRIIAGHPGGLAAGAARRGAGEESVPGLGWPERLVEEEALERPGPLEPWVLGATPALRRALVEDRWTELERLVGDALAPRGGDRALLARDLADAYEALSAVLTTGELRHVVVRTDEDPSSATFLRLLWLSLPLEDRARLFFVTEQRRTEHPGAHLLGISREEWGRYVPERAWVAGESEPVGAVSAGRRHWADLVVADERQDAFRRADTRAGETGLRVLGPDDLLRVGEHAFWRRRWRGRGPTLGAAAELARRERDRPSGPRAGAVGHAFGLAVAAGGEVEDAVALMVDGIEPGDRERAVRGAVRVLRERDPLRAGRIRVAAAEAFPHDPDVARGLRRLVDRESHALRALLSSPGGPAALLRGAFGPAASGDRVAVELLRLAVTGGEWTQEDGRRLAEVLPLDGREGAAAVGEIVAALLAEDASGSRIEAIAVPLVETAHASVVGHLASTLGALPEAPRGDGPPSDDGVEALRRAALRRAALDGARELDDAVVALLESAPAPMSRGYDPAFWEAILDVGSARWLTRTPVLTALSGALGAGERTFGEELPTSRVARRLARRVLDRAEADGLDDRQATALLRLLWLEGDGSTPLWLAETRSDAAPALLARLLVVPAPIPLYTRLREAFLVALERGGDARGLEPFERELAAWAPALHERIGRS